MSKVTVHLHVPYRGRVVHARTLLAIMEFHRTLLELHPDILLVPDILYGSMELGTICHVTYERDDNGSSNPS